MAEFPMFYIGPNLGGSQTTIVNISGPDCKLLLTRLSNVDKRRVVAVLWDHGSIYSPNYDWPISFSLGKEMCKNWINNLSEQDCNSVICELQGSGLLEGGTSRIAGAVPRYANITIACAMNPRDPKHSSAQASWSRLRGSLLDQIANLGRNTLAKTRTAPNPGQGAVRKSPRQKPSTKQQTACKFAVNKVSFSRLAASKASTNNHLTSNTYTGPQLPLPSASPMESARRTYVGSPYHVLFSAEQPQWLWYLMGMLAQDFHDADIEAVGKAEEDRAWIRCCDCKTYHETKESDPYTSPANHLCSQEHLRNVEIRIQRQMRDHAGYENGIFGGWA